MSVLNIDTQWVNICILEITLYCDLLITKNEIQLTVFRTQL